MPVSRNRPRAKKQNTNHTRVEYNRRSVRDLAIQIRRIDDVIEYTMRVTRGMIDQTRNLVGVDNSYINGLLRRVVNATVELNDRLRHYRELFEPIQQARDEDITGSVMNLFGEITEETHNIESNIFQPIYDVQEEINNHADKQDQVCLKLFNQLIEELEEVNPSKA